MRPTRMNILQVIHDFLPRHQAGSEIYTARLAQALSKRHHVTVLCAEYEPSTAHGFVRWRLYEGLPVVEIVNNWVGRSFEQTYRPDLVTARIDQILQAVQPDIVHIHNLFNLSFELPAIARAKGIPVAATVHDYTLVCPSGGQRVHRAESHVCVSIDPARCARCFKESPFYAQLSVGALATAAPMGWVRSVASTVQRRFPAIAKRAARAAGHTALVPVTPEAIARRLTAARDVFQAIDVCVAPSRSVAEELVKLGMDRHRVRQSPNGQIALTPIPTSRPRTPLRIGFVGTITWHKGVHVLISAVRPLPSSTYEVRVFGGLDVAPDYSLRLRDQAVGLPIRFEGAFEPARAPEVFSEIDVLVVPSLWPENAPLVIQEAFQAGVPVIGAAIGGIPEFIRDGIDGRLFNPLRPDALTAILRDLIDRPDRAGLLAASRPAVRTIEEDAADWETRYYELLDRQTTAEKAS